LAFFDTADFFAGEAFFGFFGDFSRFVANGNHFKARFSFNFDVVGFGLAFSVFKLGMCLYGIIFEHFLIKGEFKINSLI
jgi:hypothetical protein